jgi:hypothetical protein
MKMTMMPFTTTGKSSEAWIMRNFYDYVSVYSHLATSGVNMEEELRENHVGARSVEGEDSKPEVLPNFAKAHGALMKFKSFVNAHSK